MSKAIKAANLAAGAEALEILVALDYSVTQMSPYHFRVNDRLDIWPSTKRYYDHKTLRKGYFDDLVKEIRALIPSIHTAQ